MIRIAFFGHDAGDAAIRRRVQGFRDDGMAVTGFMMRRRDDVAVDWENVDLGRTRDAAMAQRVKAIFTGANEAARRRDLLASADLIYARNLDMLATAFLARRKARLKTPIVYECLDVHRLLTRRDPIGFAFRRVEGRLLARTSRLVVSSPGFLEHHFEPRHGGRYTPVLVENKLAAGGEYGPRPERTAPDAGPAAPLRIGWFGVLRCSRSLGLLLNLAQRFGDRIQIVLHGRPALTEIPDFEARIKGRSNVTFHGPYTSPEDLSRIYDGVDVVWAGDFMEAGFNSRWLLPNRLYEGGYYATPAIAPAGTETAKWSARNDAGFEADEDLLETLPALVERLLADRGLIADKRACLLDMPDEAFIQPRGVLRAMVESVLTETRDAGARQAGKAARPDSTSARNAATTRALHAREE